VEEIGVAFNDHTIQDNLREDREEKLQEGDDAGEDQRLEEDHSVLPQ
jgi:hypothetical protein